MKWEPAALMVLLLLLGLWIVWGPAVPHELRPGAELLDVHIGPAKGVLEVVHSDAGDATFRLLYRDAGASEVFDERELARRFGDDAAARIVDAGGNALFRLFSITSWASLAWVIIGLAGQGAFFGRMFIQWVISERRRESVVPEAFWWLSLIGGVALFTYFGWRQDIVGVLGQSTGVVIYARNLRLIHKRKRRALRDAARAASGNMRAEADPGDA